MYKINKTFDHMKTGMIHQKGSKYSFDELSSSEIKYLVDSSFISSVAVKSKRQKIARRVSNEDSST